jgi:hypothetical protein
MKRVKKGRKLPGWSKWFVLVRCRSCRAQLHLQKKVAKRFDLAPWTSPVPAPGDVRFPCPFCHAASRGTFQAMELAPVPGEVVRCYVHNRHGHTYHHSYAPPARATKDPARTSCPRCRRAIAKRTTDGLAVEYSAAVAVLNQEHLSDVGHPLPLEAVVAGGDT